MINKRSAAGLLAATLGGSACGGSTALPSTVDTSSTDTAATSDITGDPAAQTATAGASTPRAVSAATAPTAEFTLEDADWGKTWRRLSTPSISRGGAMVAGAPGGWLALSTRDQDGTKNPPPPDSFAYFSTDGTHWRAVPTPGDYPLQGGSVAYGGGRYVITGTRSETVLLDSTDGEAWHEQSLDGPSFAFYNGPVTYVRDRFLYMSGAFWGSADAEHWDQLPHDYPFALIDQIAYGNGVYLGVGIQMQLSTDGVEWHMAPLDCALPIDCESIPDGNLQPAPVGGVFFAEGLFHIWQYQSGYQLPQGELTSPDGKSWQYVPGPFPDAYIAGHFVQFRGTQPAVWLAGDSTPRPIGLIRRSNGVSGSSTALPSATDSTSDAVTVDDPPPAEADLSWSDGLDCSNARCVLIHSQLYLVP
jgi:hypothetical protein